MAKPITLQLGLVTMQPPPVRRRWGSTAARCSGLTSGISRGTSASMRWLRAFDTTMCPCRARASSASPATDESSPEKSRRERNGPAIVPTVSPATASGRALARRQVAASRYGRPADRSDAATSATSNQGWPASSCTNRCPTAPVAPRTATGIFAMSNFTLRSARPGAGGAAYGTLSRMDSGRAWAVALALAAAACGSSPPGASSSGGETGLTFPSGDVRLSYALDLPAGPGPFPALVFGHGSGRSTKQDAAPLASRLAARGYAVLRYDKRGVGASGGTYEGVGVANSERMFELLAGDMAAGRAFLASRPEIDARRIGLIGASQAGWIVPAAAARGGAWCMVLLSGPTVSVGEEIFYSDLAEGTTTPFEELSARLLGFSGAR